MFVLLRFRGKRSSCEIRRPLVPLLAVIRAANVALDEPEEDKDWFIGE